MMKIKKLNNKGLTAVEILVCFVLMVILTVSMYGTVISYKNKQNIESDRDKIVAYKNLLTKEIQDDLIKKGLLDAKLIENISSDGNNTDKYYKVEFTFRDGTKKTLEVTAQYARDFEACSGNLTIEEEGACRYDKDDILKISYGSAPGADDYTSYVLPDLGYGYNGNVYASEYGAQCSGNYDENGVELDETDKQGCKVYDFRISNVIVETEDIFNFYVGFYHPDFETRYGIDIVYPITLSVEQSALDLGPLCGTQTPERIDWDNTPEVSISVECVAREGGMPCAQPSFSGTFNSDSKINYIVISSTDGNETRCPVSTYIDRTVPTTPTVVSTEGFPSGTWKTKNFTLTVTSSDRHSGIAYYQYCYPGADNNCGQGEWTTYNGSIRAEVSPGEFVYETSAFSQERSEKVWIRAVDRANNKSAPGEFIINIDKSGPVISNVNFDRTTRVLTATITDNISKVSEYALTKTSTEPTSYTNITDTLTYNLSKTIDESYSGPYYIWAKDVVGNKASKVEVNIPKSNLDIVHSYRCANDRAGSEPYEMTYTGNCDVSGDSTNWKVKFLSDGDLKFISNVDIDVFLVGGGAAGKSTDGSSGKNGGSGGYTLTKKNVTVNANQNYAIVIGLGGQSSGASGQASTAFGFKANGGTLMAGGSGGGAGGFYGGTYRCNNGGSGAKDGNSAGTVDITEGGSGQRDVTGPNGEKGSTREFGESTGELYAGGGGGGAAKKDDPNNYCSGTNGSAGEGGGGTPSKTQSEADGKANTGGGGAGEKNGYKTGKGGSGVVVIRNKR